MATTISSGQIDINYINQFFKKGLNLNAYRGTNYFVVGNTSLTPTGTFSSGAIAFGDFYNKANTSSGWKVIFLTSGTTWTVPNDWNVANNEVECVGGGGTGATGSGTYGGGGGAYSANTNLNLTPGASITIAIGGADGDTCFGGSTLTGTGTLVSAEGGTIRVPGLTGNGRGQTKFRGGYAQGTGGAAAAGPAAVGANSTTSTGATGGVVYATSNPGGVTASSGSGGNAGSGTTGSPGTVYGGGGGRGGSVSSKSGTTYYSGGAGAQGIIIISYQPTIN